MNEGSGSGAGPESEVVLERRVGAEGHVIELVSRGGTFDVREDGETVLRSGLARDGGELARLSLAPLGQRDDVTVLLAGLGFGRTLRAVLSIRGIARVDVIERSAALIEFCRGPLAELSGDALADPRVHVHAGDLMSVLKGFRYDPPPDSPAAEGGWLALILDVDSGPALPSRPSNAVLSPARRIV